MEQHMDSKYWSERYQQNTTGWDIGQVSTPIKAYIDQLANKDIAVMIPGCGNAYEAEYLLEQGFTNITLVDISPLLAESISRKFKLVLGKKIQVICDDFFNIDQSYDLILEQTFFCALNPALRKKYADKMFSLLKPGGKIAGLLFNRSFPGGPPFGGNELEYRKLFEEKFKIRVMEPCYNSIPSRAGTELFIILEKKN
jgi:SAM-dependent methyltransferase